MLLRGFLVIYCCLFCIFLHVFEGAGLDWRVFVA